MGQARIAESPPRNCRPFRGLTNEPYKHRAGLLGKDTSVTLEVDRESEVPTWPDDARSIPHPRDHVVRIRSRHRDAGRPLRSWTGGNRRHDNGLPARAVRFRAIRILKTLDLKFEGTGRIGL